MQDMSQPFTFYRKIQPQASTHRSRNSVRFQNNREKNRLGSGRNLGRRGAILPSGAPNDFSRRHAVDVKIVMTVRFKLKSAFGFGDGVVDFFDFALVAENLFGL